MSAVSFAAAATTAAPNTRCPASIAPLPASRPAANSEVVPFPNLQEIAS
jgi:hypothetical protein